MHKNSLEAWNDEVKPNLRKRQVQVLKVMQHLAEGTAKDVMNATGQPSNVIHPRLGELRDLGMLTENGDKKIDGRKHTVYVVTVKGMEVDTEQVADIQPANKYYSRGDYKAFARQYYDYMKPKLTPEEQEKLYSNLKTFISTIK